MSMILTFIILTTISVSSIWYTLVKSPGHFKGCGADRIYEIKRYRNPKKPYTREIMDWTIFSL